MCSAPFEHMYENYPESDAGGLTKYHCDIYASS